MRKLIFEVNDAEIISEADGQFALARIHAFSSGKNRHNLTCDVETLKRTAHTLYEKPVVFDFDPAWGDFGGHIDEPFIAGFIVPDSAKFVELKDGRIGLTVLAKIWKYYSRNFVDIFKADSKHERKVSVEMDLREVEDDKQTGLGKMLDFVYTAIAVLGTFVTEASPDAHMRMLSFSEVEDKEEYFETFARYDEIDFTIPKTVKKSAQNGLDLRKEHNRGGTSVGLATARYLVKNDVARPEKVKHIAKYFPRHAKDNLSDKTSAGWIAWQLWGGNAGRNWSSKLVEQMEEADEKMAVYFEEGFMPYSSIKDANPAIRGIKPPVTLAQANSIAKQADAIGTDKEKNGWAIAISNFKKSHKVKDGQWVKKEKVSTQYAISKDDWGSGQSVSIDKDKESMSTTPWGNVDKPTLMEKVLKANNYKTLVKEVYAKVEAGWEDAPSQHLKYPIMEIKGGKAVYNRYALSSALAYARKGNEDKVVSKLESIYKDMELDSGEEEMTLKDKKKEQEDFMADEEARKGDGTSDEAPKEEEKEEEKDQTFEEEDETPEEEVKEEEEEPDAEMAQNAYERVGEVMGMLEGMEGFSALSEMETVDFESLVPVMHEKMIAMQAELDELSEYKSGIEAQAFQAQVDSIIAEVNNVIPSDQLEALKEESKNFSLETIDGWKNKVRAMAFEFSKNADPEKKEEFVRYALPFDNAVTKKNGQPFS